MTRRDSQIDKPQSGHPKRAELPAVNINTGAQSINTEITSLQYRLVMADPSFQFYPFIAICHSQKIVKSSGPK